MVGRSLRFEITPQENEDDLTGWFKYFNDVGLDLLCFLITWKRCKLQRLDEDIIYLKGKVVSYNQPLKFFPRLLAFWGRYIDNILPFDGDLMSLNLFFQQFNANSLGISNT